MDEYADYAGRLLADRYRLPRPPAESYDLAESIAYDTASGQEVLVRQVPLPETVDAEVLGEDPYGPRTGGTFGGTGARATRSPADPAVRRALEAAVAAAQLPDHPRLDQVFDVFVEGDGLWIVSELLPATPLAVLLADQPLGAHRAAEIAADLLTALRVVHAHGWTHRNITARTVLICDDGRALLTGLAVGAAQEALCGYDPLPEPGGRTTRPPSGTIPGAQGTPGVPDAPGVLGAPMAPDGPAEPGGVAGRAPATWTGSALPEGFDPRAAGPGGQEPAPANTAERYGPAGQGFDGPEPSGQPADDEPHGFLGFRGLPPDEAAAEPGPGPGSPTGHAAPPGPAVPPGSAVPPGLAPPPGHAAPPERGGPAGTGHRAVPARSPSRPVRSNAIAAYRAGTRRAAAHRAGEPEPQTPAQPSVPPQESAPGRPFGAGRPPASGQSAVPPQPSVPPQPQAPARPAAERELRDPGAAAAARPGPNGDWWSAPPRRTPRQRAPEEVAPPAGREALPRLPQGAEAATPTALPGSRQPDSRPVHATWRTAEPTAPEQPPAASRPPAVPEQQGAPEPAPHTAEPPEADAERARPWDGTDEQPDGRYRGPAGALAAERARQARMTMVGAVTERWAPEQAGPVYENWRLAPPVGPAADLWALGALLFRAVQGHAPYPEDSVAELVQMVCAEPPAFAEDCGPLRPVVESLMRQDPTERPDFEVLRGWLRSLIRSAPEPDAGWHTVTAPVDPGAGGPANPRRLPILRRRGELVRRRRAGGRRPAAAAPGRPAPETAQPPQLSARERRRLVREQERRYKEQRRQERQRQQQFRRDQRLQRSAQPPVPPLPPTSAPNPTSAPYGPQPGQEPYGTTHADRPRRAKGAARAPRSPHRTGRWALGLVLGGAAACVAYAVWFLPQDPQGGTGDQRQSSVGEPEPPGAGGGTSREDDGGEGKGDGKGRGEHGTGGRTGQPPGGAAGTRVPDGYQLSRDPAGFQIAVPDSFNRRSTTAHGQVDYNGGEVEMVIANGRDSTARFGKDPMAYQSDDELELAAYRASDWASTSGLRRIDVGDRVMAEGTFTWQDNGREVYARNRAMILDGRYHVLLVMGAESHKKEIDRYFEDVADTYRVTK